MKNFLADFIIKDAVAVSDKIDFGEIKGKSVMITGASGLVGHYLLATLNRAAKKGNAPSKVFLVVKNDLPPYFKKILAGMKVKVLNGDLTDNSFVKKLPKADYIIHASGYGQPGKFMADPVKTLELNTSVTFGMMEKLNPAGRFLFISSSEVYSGLPNPPYKEDQIGTTNTNHPRSCYIEGKRCGEAIMSAYRAKGVNAKSARLCLAYGPGTRPDDARAINNFIKKALTEKKIGLMDQGQAFRTYIYITDAVEILFRILLSGKSDIYNAGGKSRTTIKALAESIGKITGVPVNLPKNTEKGMAGAPDDVYLDMAKVEKEFGKKNYVSLEEGLKKTIEWQKNIY